MFEIVWAAVVVRVQAMPYDDQHDGDDDDEERRRRENGVGRRWKRSRRPSE